MSVLVNDFVLDTRCVADEKKIKNAVHILFECSLGMVLKLVAKGGIV